MTAQFPPLGSGENFRQVIPVSVPSSTWTINHILEGRPAVTTVDSSDKIVHGDVDYVSDSQIVIEFSVPFSGAVYLS